MKYRCPDWRVGDEYWNLWLVNDIYEARRAGVVALVGRGRVVLKNGLHYGHGEGLAFRSKADADGYARLVTPAIGRLR